MTIDVDDERGFELGKEFREADGAEDADHPLMASAVDPYANPPL